MNSQLIDIIKSEFERRVIEESFGRIEKCSQILSEDEFWHKPNENSNSVGNLVLHLSGNVRQYIHSGIDGQKDERDRDAEFSTRNIKNKETLVSELKEILAEANSIVSKLSLNELNEKRTVQGFSENVLSIVVHVIEHLSYHVGQITYYTKYLKDIDTGYYGGQDLNVTS